MANFKKKILLHQKLVVFFYLVLLLTCQVGAQEPELPGVGAVDESTWEPPTPSERYSIREEESVEPQQMDAELFLTSTGENTIENGVFTARENVELLYGEVSLYADKMTYDMNTGWASAEGNARLFRGDGTMLVGNRMEYNTRSGEVRSGTTRGAMLPFIFLTQETTTREIPDEDGAAVEAEPDAEKKPNLEYNLTNTRFSTENVQRPGFRITARSVQHRPDINRTVFRNVTMYAGNVPIMWWPKITYQPGSSDFALQVTPGYNSEWGAFLLLAYGLEVRPGLYTRPRLDWRSQRGVAGGMDTHWFHGRRLNRSEGAKGQGQFNFYLAGDSAPQRAPEDGRPDAGIRYHFQARERYYVTSSRDFYLSLSGDLLSDATFLRDFFPAQYRLERQPDNHAEIVRRFPNAQASILVRPQLNPFFETVERLPEVRLDIPRQQIFSEAPFYYGGQTSLARLQRRFATSDNISNHVGDYNATRFDTYHELSMPFRVANALQLVASAGWRGTFYDDSLPRYREVTPEGKKFRFRDNIRVLDEDTEVELKRVPGTGGSSVFRSLFALNLEGSLKMHRIYNWTKLAWGIDRIRHVMEPWFHFSYIPQPWKSTRSEVMQFDQRFGSTRLDPLSFPQYNSTDDISERLTLRLGLDHRFQTKRDGMNYTLLAISSYIDIDPWEKTYHRPTSNLFNQITYHPVPWLRFAFFASTDIHQGGYHEYNSSVQWQIARPLAVRLSHRFLDNSDVFRDSNQLAMRWFWRIDDNWALSTRHTFEFADSSFNGGSGDLLRTQEYSIHRDLSAWRASLTTRWDNNSGRPDEFSVFLTFTLKAFPDVEIPLGYTDDGGSNDTSFGLSP